MARRLARSKAAAEGSACGGIRGAVALLLVSVLVLESGCSAWNRMAPPKDGFTSKPTQRQRITLEDQSKIEVTGLRVDGDTVRFEPGKNAGTMHALPTASMVRYEERHFDPVGTVLITAAVGAAVFYGLIFYYAATGQLDVITHPAQNTSAPQGSPVATPLPTAQGSRP